MSVTAMAVVGKCTLLITMHVILHELLYVPITCYDFAILLGQLVYFVAVSYAYSIHIKMM